MSRVPKKPDFVTISIYAVLAVFVIYFSAALGACFDLSLDEDGKADFDLLTSSLESTLMNTDLVFEKIAEGANRMFAQLTQKGGMDRLEKNKYAPPTYKTDERYLLTTKLMCGSCGSTMVGESGTGRNDKKYHYYKCSNAKRKNGCKQHTIRKYDFEEAVIQKIVSYVFNNEIIGGIVDRVLQWQEKSNTTLPLLQSQLADVEKALSNVMMGYNKSYHKEPNG